MSFDQINYILEIQNCDRFWELVRILQPGLKFFSPSSGVVSTCIHEFKFYQMLWKITLDHVTEFYQAPKIHQHLKLDSQTNFTISHEKLKTIIRMLSQLFVIWSNIIKLLPSKVCVSSVHVWHWVKKWKQWNDQVLL